MMWDFQAIVNKIDHPRGPKVWSLLLAQFSIYLQKRMGSIKLIDRTADQVDCDVTNNTASPEGSMCVLTTAELRAVASSVNCLTSCIHRASMWIKSSITIKKLAWALGQGEHYCLSFLGGWSLPSPLRIAQIASRWASLWLLSITQMPSRLSAFNALCLGLETMESLAVLMSQV